VAGQPPFGEPGQPPPKTPPGGDDPALERPPTSEAEEGARRDRILLADLVRWYQARNLPLDVPLRDYVPGVDEEGRSSSTANRMRAAANLMVAHGLRVKYASGWEGRGRPYPFSPSAGMICHHTASPTDIDNILINGRSDLPGPLCHWALHADGAWVLIASGYANHAGESKPGAPTNSNGWGTEATGPKTSGAYGPGAFANYDSYKAGMACIMRAEGWPVSRIWGHKESCQPPGRKIDPSFDMNQFRSGVAQAMAGPPPGEDDVPAYSQWSVADRKKLVEDVIKAITRGEMPDGSRPDHIVASSTGKIRDMQDLFGWGDGRSVPLSQDTHGDMNVKSAIQRLGEIAKQLDEIQAALTPSS
jgi:N-acetylmuramoyl-L-alanine amidase